MRNVTLTSAADGKLTVNGSDFLGYGGEHNNCLLTVDLVAQANTCFAGAGYFRIVLDGDYSEKLYVTNEKITYTLPQRVVNPPIVKCQVIGYTEANGVPTVIAKSSVARLRVEGSEKPGEEIEKSPTVFETAVAKAEQKAAASESSALRSEAAAINSEASALRADTDKATAITKATEAAASATAAYAYAEAANISKQNAAVSASAAQSYVAEAISAAEDAEGYADQAEDYVNTMKKDCADRLKAEVTGNTLIIDDVSPNNSDVEITGTAGESVKITGRNIFDNTSVLLAGSLFDHQYYSATVSGNNITFAGVYASANGAGPAVRVTPGATYTVSFTGAGSWNQALGFTYTFAANIDENNEIVGASATYTNEVTVGAENTISFTVPQNKNYVVFSGIGPSRQSAIAENFMLEIGGVAHSFEEYSGETVTVGALGSVTTELPHDSNVVFGNNITVKYSRDINSAYTKLVNAIISLGGNI